MVEILGYDFDDMCFGVGILLAIIVLGCIWVVTPKMGLTPFPLWQRLIISLAIIVIAPIMVDKVGNK